MKAKIIGYIVVDCCEDWEQVLSLKLGDGLPGLGILEWPDGPDKRTVFPTRKAAREAINRTHYYAQAFLGEGQSRLPNRELCRIHPVVGVPS